MLSRRSTLLATAAGAIVLLSGCATKPPHAANADGTYCYRIGKIGRQKLTCTVVPVPSPSVEAEAKRFEGAPGALTVYVVRNRWGDTRNPVPVALDDQPSVASIPKSLIRWRLAPGIHRLELRWDGRTSEIAINGGEHEVLFVELVGTVWAWGSNYRWKAGSLPESKDRSVKAKLVADVDLSR